MLEQLGWRRGAEGDAGDLGVDEPAGQRQKGFRRFGEKGVAHRLLPGRHEICPGFRRRPDHAGSALPQQIGHGAHDQGAEYVDPPVVGVLAWHHRPLADPGAGVTGGHGGREAGLVEEDHIARARVGRQLIRQDLRHQHHFSQKLLP